jgi:peptidoglycan/xylan/chitin deacetylase (PgdA/CDA1 family)
MKNKWYILLYHNVSWEENAYVKGIGGTCPPDIFREHLRYLNKAGKFVSIEEGLELSFHDKITRPVFSFWFDDGLSGVRQYASPLLKRYETEGAISVCSRFMDRKEIFWRFKLSYLSYIDGLRFLRTRLRKYGYKLGMPVKDFCIANFSETMAREIDEVFQSLVSKEKQEEAFRLFETDEGITDLKKQGWVIGNHTAAHYPVGYDSFADKLVSHFEECDEKLNRLLGEPCKFWVLPFGVTEAAARKVTDKLQFGPKTRYLVFADDKFHEQQPEDGLLYRLNTPVCSGNSLMRFLNSQ